ncbi:hypothetical protein ACJMK2_036910 [Sinanodonta woodiana]|uniref:Uncharacterized protein n=1 Tax=Sinanodonta woodiana TaxID=1069815 RepID=A0ABD3WK09_SINWO
MLERTARIYRNQKLFQELLATIFVPHHPPADVDKEELNLPSKDPPVYFFHQINYKERQLKQAQSLYLRISWLQQMPHNPKREPPQQEEAN